MLLKSGPRSAYTLLEVVLASAIGVILMGALYVAMEVQLRHAQAGRELIAQGTLVRALMARISADINASIGPVQPVIAVSSSSSGMGGSSAAASGGSAGASNASSGTSASATSSSASGTAAVINTPVQGDNQTLVLTVAKWPRELDMTPNASPELQPVAADVRRISYWLAGANSSSPLGLARQEVRPVTTSDPTLSATPPNIPDENTYVIAEEVKSLTFQYWDGSGWQDSWDGTQSGTDGSTPKGPPLAIAVTLEVTLPGTTAPGAAPRTKTYRQVVPLVTANGATQASNSSTTQTSP